MYVKKRIVHKCALTNHWFECVVSIDVRRKTQWFFTVSSTHVRQNTKVFLLTPGVQQIFFYDFLNYICFIVFHLYSIDVPHNSLDVHKNTNGLT